MKIESRLAVFRADAGPTIGWGHVMALFRSCPHLARCGMALRLGHGVR